MNRGGSHWHDALISRFADRKNIDRDALYARYFMDLPKAAVFECFNLIEEEYQIPSGLLRPEDKLTKIVEPVTTKNPLRWLVYQSRAGDIEFELQRQLDKRLRQHGTQEAWTTVNTVDDLIRAWCGKRPT